MWRLELDEDFFRIYDSKKMIAGYFDPNYGKVSKVNYDDTVSNMLKNHDKISGGVMMLPLVKFGLFDTDLDTSISEVEKNVCQVQARLEKWRQFLHDSNNLRHSVRISHTSQDMLTIAFPVKFSRSTPLHKDDLIDELFSTLDLLQKSDLL